MRHFRLFFIVLSMIMLTATSMGSGVSGIPEYSRDLPQSLKNNCNVCHEKASGGPINDFGKDYAMYGHVMDAVEGLDSDGDGYDNGVELAAGTFPGFPDSYPGKKKGLDPVIIAVAVVLVAGIGLVLRKRAS